MIEGTNRSIMRLKSKNTGQYESAQPKEAMYAVNARLAEPVSDLNDEELVRQFQSGNKDAFRLIVERNQEKVRSIILYSLNRADLVDDIAQDVFIKAYVALDTFRFDSKFYTWLYRITVNKCRDELRKRRWKRFISLNNDRSHESVMPPQQLISENHDDGFAEAVRLALEKVPLKHREIIILKDIEDHSYEEIAEILECEMGTVKSRLSRARAILRKQLEPYLNEML
jgi:RNA polymerase sigma-70 factor, ECF subfamily